MAPTNDHHHNHRNIHHLTAFLHSTAANIATFLTPKPPKTTPSQPLLTSSSSTFTNLFLPLPLPFSDSTRRDSAESPPSHSPRPNLGSPEFPSMVRIGGMRASGRTGVGGGDGGPAFVGQVFSMCDVTGTGLMAVSSHFDVPFISQRAPEWIKKMWSAVVKNESGPVFRFFMDLGDAVSYVRRLNIPTGVVGSCRLDLAYEHFKEKPHLFQFVPNSRQVKAASKLLKGNKRMNGQKIDGVPVFSAQNLDIAIATPEGVKWYTPYFFDKGVLDNILEESVDQHFHSLIQSRRVQRRGDMIDDNIASEVIEESADSLWESTEVQELMDEMGQSGIPLSVISKAAEMQLLYAADRVLLGNRWLRKATGIQPKFPYIVDSFERRSAVSWSRVSKFRKSSVESQAKLAEHSSSVKLQPENEDQPLPVEQSDQHLPLGDWLRPPWSKQSPECTEADIRASMVMRWMMSGQWSPEVVTVVELKGHSDRGQKTASR